MRACEGKSTAARTSNVTAVANKCKAFAFGYKIPVCGLLTGGAPGVRLAVHDAPRAKNVGPVIR